MDAIVRSEARAARDRQAGAGFVRISALDETAVAAARREGRRAPGSGRPRRQASGRRDKHLLCHRLGDDRASRRPGTPVSEPALEHARGSRALRSARAPGRSFHRPPARRRRGRRAASSKPTSGRGARRAGACRPVRIPEPRSRPRASSRMRSRRSSRSAAKSPRPIATRSHDCCARSLGSRASERACA